MNKLIAALIAAAFSFRRHGPDRPCAAGFGPGRRRQKGPEVASEAGQEGREEGREGQRR